MLKFFSIKIVQKYFKQIFVFCATFLFLFGIREVFAGDTFGLEHADNLGLANTEVSDPREMMVNVVKFFLTFVGIIAVAIILYGGFVWMTAAGSAERVDKAKKILVSAVIGLIIIISAYTIVHFVLTATDAVINSCTEGDTRDCGCDGERTCSGGFWGPCIGSDCSLSPNNQVFRVSRTAPRNEAVDVIRNVTVKAFLNQAIAPDFLQLDLNDNYTIRKTHDIDPDTRVETPAIALPVIEDISTSSNNRVMNMNSSDACSDDAGTTNCFDEWSRFSVSINDGFENIETAGGTALDCSNGRCHFDFLTDDSIDIASPTAGIISTQICQDDGTLAPDANIIGAWGRDDYGVSEIRFYSQRESGLLMEEALEIVGGGRYEYAENQFSSTTVSVGDIYTFYAEVYDMADATDIADFSAVIRTGHCCNGVLDDTLGEEDVDCGGPDCDSCDSRDPMITWLSPDNGAVGNWITIGGRYFGSALGSVYFWDGSTWLGPAAFPDTVNSACTSNWQNNQIIVIVPAGAQTGPIRIVRNDLREDTTNNEYGPPVDDFVVNAIVRPGLCLVDPAQGSFDDVLDYHGTSFAGAGQGIFFGDDVVAIEAETSDWTNLSASGTVANLMTGRITTYVRSNGENSNYLYFSVLSDDNNNPVIDYIDPDFGPSGEYITIYGSGFRNYVNSVSKVEFTAQSDDSVYVADGFSFPEECQDSWWNRNQIVVKVPDGINIEDYDVTVTNRSDAISNIQVFAVTAGVPGPGVCLLNPDNGPVGFNIEVIGDNFGVAQGPGFVRFVSNIDVMAVNSWDNQKIELNVPVNAETGVVRVSDSVQISNGLNFQVGVCSVDADCDQTAGFEEDCCGAGTYWFGVCRPTGTCGEGGVSVTGYGWSFSTGGGELIPLTCSGYSTNESCIDSETCPNSAGACQTREDLELDIECTNASCNSNYTECQGSCVYNSATNHCEANGAPLTLICDQVDIRYPDAVCREVNGIGVWQYDSFANCPLTSYLDSNGWCTEGIIGNPTTCSLCDDDFFCDSGQCIINDEICPTNSGCDAGECILEHGICECCCEVGEELRDCCLGLTCVAGDCGDDPVNYGLCSGCRVDLDGDRTSNTLAEQQASDATCNCEGTNGKYCVIDNPSDSLDLGVCKDARTCDGNEYTSTCEADVDMCDDGYFCDIDCFCKEGTSCDGDNFPGNGCSLEVNCSSEEYCDLSDCFCKEGRSCDDNNDVSDSCGAVDRCDDDEFCDPIDCFCKDDPGLPGDPCFQDTDLSMPECNPYACGAGYECMTESYETVASACGYCCCDLDDANTEDDSCRDMNLDFYCAIDSDTTSNCYDTDIVTAPNFGICCGCQADNECSGGINQGCGEDACCRERPQVVSVEPGDAIANPVFGEVCRNAGIVVEFNQEMDADSLVPNFILLGDYGQEQCPEGTVYVTLENKKIKKYNIFYRLSLHSFEFVKKILNTFIPYNAVVAYTPPSPSRNYCAVEGSISSHIDSSENSIMIFNADDLLDPDRLYYAVIKGDVSLNSQSGVRSKWGIGMSADLLSPSLGSNTFNNVDYQNAYVWTFKTLPESQEKNGICEVSSVDIEPESYLFRTVIDDLSENDTDPDNDTFDTIEDRDKVFVSYAKSSRGQVLYPVPGYAWEWDWSIDAVNVVAFVNVPAFPNAGDRRLIEAQDGIQDGRAIVTARAFTTGTNAPGIDDIDISGQADVFVFICNNPWPPIDIGTGLWSPWQDDGINCVGGALGCHDTNYEMYYCRDTGSSATFDDLPAIVSESTISLRQTKNCSNDNNISCDIDADCGGGICELRIIKESFFFRADVPDISSITLDGATTTEGGEVLLNWNDIIATAIPPGESLSAYRIYYGRRSQDYTESVDVSLLDSHTLAVPFVVDNLSNGVTYYFAITAIFAGGGESDFSNEVVFMPEDIGAPLIPTNLQATPRDGEIEFVWDVVDGADSYKIYYGTNSGSYGNSQNIGDATEIIVSALTNGQTYYMVVTSLDENDNESGFSNEVVATPDEVAVGLFESGEIILTWNVSGLGNYEIYLEVIE